MCFNTVHAKMNLSVPVIQPSLVWNPVCWIFIHFFLPFKIWSFTEIISCVGHSAVGKKWTFRTTIFSCLGMGVCLWDFGLGTSFFLVLPLWYPKQVVLSPVQTKNEDRVLGVPFATGHLFAGKSRSVRVSVQRADGAVGREPLTPRGWVNSHALPLMIVHRQMMLCAWGTRWLQSWWPSAWLAQLSLEFQF